MSNKSLILLCGMFILISCGNQQKEVDKVQYETMVNASIDENIPDVRTDWEKENPELIAQIQNISKELPTRDYPEMMMLSIPDLSTTSNISRWNDYKKIMYSIGVNDVKLKLFEIASKAFDKVEDRLLILTQMVDSVAGYIDISAEGNDFSIFYVIPAKPLYLQRGHKIDEAEIWGQLQQLTIVPKNATWDLINDKELNDGIRIVTYQLLGDNVPIEGAGLRVLLREDTIGDNKFQWIFQVHLSGSRILDKIMPTTQNIQENKPEIDFEKNCLSIANDPNLSNIRILDIIEGSLIIRCENECKLYRKYNLYPARVSSSNYTYIECYKDFQSGKAEISSSRRYLGSYSGRATSEIGEPYASILKPKTDGTRDYGPSYNGIGYSNVIGVTGQNCNLLSHYDWSDSTGAYILDNGYSFTNICLVPDSRGNDYGANGSEDKSRFIHCNSAFYFDYCTSSTTMDLNIIYPAKQASSSSWNWSNYIYQRRNAQIFYYLNWMHDAISPYISENRCKQSLNLIFDYIDYRSGDFSDPHGRVNTDACAIEIGRFGDTSPNIVWSPVAVTFHEYGHLLTLNMKSNSVNKFWLLGSANDRPNIECRRKGGDGLSVLPLMGWWERNGEGLAMANQDIFSQYETLSTDVYWTQKYPVNNYSDNYAEVIISLAWTTGWHNAFRAMTTNTGLRATNDSICSGVYLSGFSVKDKRDYWNSAGTVDNTTQCACYKNIQPNPCGCATTPDHRSEREDAALAIAYGGINWFPFEVDKAFNSLTTESGNKWSDDLTNVWYTGPSISRPWSSWGDNNTIEINISTKTYSQYKINTLPAGAWDTDHFSFFPGYGETYYIEAISLDNRDLELWIINRDFYQVAYNDNCSAYTLNPCVTVQLFDANTHYIRIKDKALGEGRYTLNFRQVNDDHNDYEPEATPIAIGENSFDSYTKGAIRSGDVDMFRVFVPNSASYSTPLIRFKTCTEGVPATLRARLYRSQRDATGRFVKILPEVASASILSSCPTWDLNTWTPVGNVPEGWYFIEVSSNMPGGTDSYRIKIEGNNTANCPPPYGCDSLSSYSNPINVNTYWDKMYNDDAQNKIFRSAGYLRTYGSSDYYYLDMRQLAGRPVTIDVYGLDGGNGLPKFKPKIKLLSGCQDQTADSGYCDEPTSLPANSILEEDEGGPISFSSHLDFKAMHNQIYIIEITKLSSVVPLPYQIFIDVKKQSLADPVLQSWN